MPSNLKVVGETEVPSPSPVETAAPSRRSSTVSPDTIAVFQEVRRILNARAGALVAMVAAAILTGWAMYLGTVMGLAIAASFDAFVFLPIALIAYSRHQG